MKNNNRTRIIVVILILLFVAMSIIIDSLSIRKSNKSHYEVSSNLTLVTTEGANVEINKYVDSNNKVTFAGDKEYAILVRTRDELDRVILEQYFDENNNPCERSGGYCAIRFSYGDNTRTHCYLDSNSNPTDITAGYSFVVRTYLSDETNDFTDMYFDKDMNPVSNSVDCYGISYFYEGDLNTSYVWLDKDGNPMNSSSGYSKVVRMFDSENRVIEEMYFDYENNPCCNTKGEYGISITYDENNRRGTVTSLDSSGNPIINKAGYSRIDYTYNIYGGINTERYYDLDGNPCSSGKNLYGIRHDGDRVYYLDKSGNDAISIDSILTNYPFMVGVFGILVCLIFIFAPRKVNYVVVALYFVFIMYETILYRISHAPTMNLELFWSYKQFFTNEALRIEILNNIWLFVPYSLGLLSVIKNKKIVIPLLLLPLVIEIVQFIFGIGLAELDDLISNGLGELIGIGVYCVFAKSVTYAGFRGGTHRATL